MRLDDHFRLKHAYSQPFFLSRLERPEERVPQELRAHTAAIIADGKKGSAISLTCLNADLPAGSNRVASVEKQVRYDALQLLTIDYHLWQGAEVLHDLDTRDLVQILQRVHDELVQIRLDGLQLQLLSQNAESVDVNVNPVERIFDSAQSVRSKRGIIEMKRKILQGQAKS